MSKLLSLRKLKTALRNNMPMREFFMSATFRHHVEGIIKMVAERYNNAVIYFSPEWGGDVVAYTDNHRVVINLDNDLVNGLDDLDRRYLAVLGLLGHELGHVLWTDFGQIAAWHNSVLEGKFYGNYDPCFQGTVDEILAYKEDQVVVSFLVQVYHNAANILEDAYVNYRVSDTYTGTFNHALKMLHGIQFKDELESSGQDLPDLLNIILSVFVGHKMPEIAKKYKNEVAEIRGLVGDIEHKTEVEDRVAAYNNFFLYLWPWMKPVIDNIQKQEQQQEQQQQQGNGEGQEGEGQISSGQSSGNSSCRQSKRRQKSKSGGSSSGQQVAQNALDKMQKSSQEGQGKGIENEQKEKTGEEGKGQTGKTEKQNDASQDGENQNDGHQNGEEKRDDERKAENEQKEEGKNAENEDEKSEDSAKSESFSEVPASVKFDGHSGAADEFQNALEALLSDFAKEMSRKNTELAESLISEESAKEITDDKGSCHYNYRCSVNRKTGERKQMEYNIAAKNLIPISKRLQKSVGALMEDKLEGGCMKNLLRGNKINPAASASNDGRIFKRNCLPEQQDLAVSLLIDESGSMCGNRIEKALETAIIIEDFCAGLGVPVAITGHRDSYGCQIDEFIRFEDTGKNRKYNLAQLSAGGCNRDGLALRYCIKKLLERDEENKLMIIISDGRPNSDGYSGSVAAADLYGAKKELEKKGGKLIAAAIGEDKDAIHQIYRDSFLDITDLSTLPMKMVKLISHYLKD